MEVEDGVLAKIIFLSKHSIEIPLIKQVVFKIANAWVLLQQMLSLPATIKIQGFHMIPQEIGVIVKSLVTSGLVCLQIQDQWQISIVSDAVNQRITGKI